MNDPRDERIADLETVAEAFLEDAKRTEKHAYKLRSEAASLKRQIRREKLIADPLICKDHGATCLLDDGLHGSGYPYHVTIAAGKVVHSGEACRGGHTIGRLSDFTPEELATYRKMVNA